jgi:hypothetical protein
MVVPPPADRLDHLIGYDCLTYRDAVGRHGRCTSQPQQSDAGGRNGRKDETSHFITSLLCVALSSS